ncbi:hypothetical protein [Clostridium gasigenes]|uniref:Uncharacterized protein n=1 Tax=Clostridium gasigenes TaxID=94869 RepID=A0A1H0V4E9_9CLOT|nr:hypothetical protein [Clostridium gasigenes]SDP73244.1 hypothetical protein SAMN04488529_11440 [Clostridium gasigenes]
MIIINNVNEVNKLSNLKGGNSLSIEIKNKIIHLYKNLGNQEQSLDKFKLNNYIGEIIILKYEEIKFEKDKLIINYNKNCIKECPSWIEEKDFDGVIYYNIFIVLGYMNFVDIYIDKQNVSKELKKYIEAFKYN